MPRTERLDVIVPMPLHWRKRWQRGFNQSELLAHGIARKSRLPAVNALRRRRFTPAQAGLTNTERRKNVGACAGRRPFIGQGILLIDDVLTTGSTAACARALRDAGAATVAAVARADRPLLAIPQSTPEENHNGE